MMHCVRWGHTLSRCHYARCEVGGAATGRALEAVERGVDDPTWEQPNARCSGGNRAIQNIAGPNVNSPVFFRAVRHFFSAARQAKLLSPPPAGQSASPRVRGFKHPSSLSAAPGRLLIQYPPGHENSMNLGGGGPAAARADPPPQPLRRCEGPFWMTPRPQHGLGPRAGAGGLALRRRRAPASAQARRGLASGGPRPVRALADRQDCAP